MSSSNPAPELSIIVPFFNEEENVRTLLAELRVALEGWGGSHEAVLVNDASTDGTLEALNAAASEWKACVLVRLPRNSGQAAALLAGMAKARGRLIATLDGDGQNNPADIPAMVARLGDADMVAGVRMRRQDSALRLGMSRLANAVRSRFLQDGVRDSGCALKVFRREVVGAFLPIRTLYSFMPALAVAAGYTVVEHPVSHRARKAGQSKYGLGMMLWRPLVDMLGVRWFQSRRILEVVR